MDIVDAAREWMGTPWRHQCAIKGRGIDCQSLLRYSAEKIGLNLPDIPEDYSRTPSHSLKQWLDKHLQPCEQQPGCIALMNLGTDIPYHLAIITDIGLIHAWNGGPRKVVEHRIDQHWQRRIVQCYKMGDT